VNSSFSFQFINNNYRTTGARIMKSGMEIMTIRICIQNYSYISANQNMVI
jgi:hypothetical protein